LETYYAHPGTVDGDDILDGNITLRLVQAVAARLIEGTKRLGIKASDVKLST
jgi:hypothetical protein